jgi:hypothetical protein
MFVYTDFFQELTEVNTISKKLFSHFIQIPSAAMQIKDVMLSAPPTKRQQLQVLCISICCLACITWNLYIILILIFMMNF